MGAMIKAPASVSRRGIGTAHGIANETGRDRLRRDGRLEGMIRWLRRSAAVLALTAAGAVLMAAHEPQRHFLWTVRGEGPMVAYVLGSLHVLTPDFYPLAGPIDLAFDASGTLVEEIDFAELEDPATLVAAMGRAMFLDGRTLDQVVSKGLFDRVMATAAPAGIPRAALERMKPWMAAMSLTAPALRRAGFDPAQGVDRHYYNRARASGMAIEALETVAYQLERFDGMPMPLQEQMLATVLDDLDTQIDQVRVIADAWARGDVEAIEHLLLEAFRGSPEIHARLLTERNRSWVPTVESCLEREKPCFIVVGAAHLVGPDSLVAMLRDRGYEVVQQ